MYYWWFKNFNKIGIIKNLIPKFDNIVIVGGMANNILSHEGNQIEDQLKRKIVGTIINEIFETAKNYPCEIIYPEDVSVGKNMNDKAQIKELNQITTDDIILDIGPKTINKIKAIVENSKTILWNGPAIFFENSNFANGSYEIAKAIAKKNKTKTIFSVVGGGDTIAVINQINAIKNFNFVSTAGGAFLEYLEGRELPGIKSSKNNMSELNNTVLKILENGKGILAADESTATMTKRLESVNVPSTPENRLLFRETLFMHQA